MLAGIISIVLVIIAIVEIIKGNGFAVVLALIIFGMARDRYTDSRRMHKWWNEK